MRSEARSKSLSLVQWRDIVCDRHETTFVPTSRMFRTGLANDVANEFRWQAAPAARARCVVRPGALPWKNSTVRHLLPPFLHELYVVFFAP